MYLAGLGLYVNGGEPIPEQPGVVGAFVKYIAEGSVAAQLKGELTAGN